MRSREFGERDKAVLDVLLKQYDFLRTEVIQSIYLEHAAIIGLYTSLGLILAAFITKFDILDLSSIDFEKHVFLFTLIIVQIIISSFGSLFLKEQARNRRACSFLKAIEYLINEKIGEIGVYWENYITSELIAKKIEKAEYVNFNIPINPQYYKNRLLGVGLPVFLPNILITLAIGFILCPSRVERILIFSIVVVGITLCIFYKENESTLYKENRLTSLTFFINDILKSCKKYLFPLIFASVILYITLYFFCEKSTLILSTLFVTSFLITFLWALMIIYKSGFPLRAENVPSRGEVLEWLKEEQSKILLKGVHSTFTLKGDEVEMEVHVVTDGLSEKIWDIEIFPEDQDPRWKSVEGIEAPECWNIKNKDNRVRFYTDVKPLKECEPVKFGLKIRPKEIVKHNKIYFIRIHLTDKNQENIGEMISWPGIASTFTHKDGVVETEVHVIGDELDRKIFDIEILPEAQHPPWESAEGLLAPEGWDYEKLGNGVRFCTKTNPLKKCKPVRFKFKVRAKEISRYITLKTLREVMALKN